MRCFHLVPVLLLLALGGARAQEPAGRPLEVRPLLPLGDGEWIEAVREDGHRVRLQAGRDGDFRGPLPPGDAPFRLLRLPGEVPEATPGGAPHPGHLPGGPPGPVWIFPAAWEDRPASRLQSFRTGLHEDLALAGSSRVPGPRTLRVHLPRAYLTRPERAFPVVYLLDGQNVLDPGTSFGGIEWGLDEVAARLEAQGAPPVILVGVDNGMGRRLHEYTFLADPEHGGGGAAEHLDFLLQEVEPFLAARYRLAPGRRAMVGSSLGGLFGLWAALARPGAFRAVAALSPSLWWADEALLRLPAGASPRGRLWVDMGSEEGEHSLEQLHRLEARLGALGWPVGDDLMVAPIPGAPHRERAWADRAARVLEFLTRDL